MYYSFMSSKLQKYKIMRIMSKQLLQNVYKTIFYFPVSKLILNIYERYDNQIVAYYVISKNITDFYVFGIWA